MRPELRAAARELTAIVVGGLMLAMAWLIPFQEAWKKGWTDHEFNAAMGQLVGATGDQIPRQGLIFGVAAAIALTAVHAVACRLLRRHWLVQGALAAALLFLLWGLVFAPLAGDRTDVPGGLFGADAGASAVVWAAVSAVIAGVVLGRVYALVRDAAWWERKHFDLRESIETIFTEEHPEQGRTGYRPEGFTE